MHHNRFDSYPAEPHWQPRPQPLAAHRGTVEPRPFIKRQYAFLIVACLVAAHTIFYSTSVLLTRLPDGTLRLPPKASAPFLSPSTTTTTATTTTTSISVSSSRRNSPTPVNPVDALPTCNLTASPFALEMRGQGYFPDLAAFIYTNTLLLEDVHPGSFWVITRQSSSDNQPVPAVDWGLTPPGPSALLPLPKGIMPLFHRAPHSVTCSRDQVRLQWAAAHPDVEHCCPLHLRTELLDDDAGVALSGMGHPQGLFFRVSLTHLLQQESQSHSQSGTESGGETHGLLARQEHELFVADDRFEGGERLFPMRSMTKALVALLAMALQDRELLAVGDPVYEYLPQWNWGVYSNMTVAMLLSHTAGYEDSFSNDHALAPGNITLQESAQRTRKHSKLVGRPGEQFLYSEIGYQVLGAVLEAAGNDDFLVLLEELVLVPAGLCNTYIFNWWADTMPTHGPLIPNCRADAPPAPPPPEPRGRSKGQSHKRIRGLGKSAKDETEDKGKTAGGDESGTAGVGGASGARRSANPTIAFGGVTSANDLNRLLGLLANKGRAACCGPFVPAPLDEPPPPTTTTTATTSTKANKHGKKPSRKAPPPRPTRRKGSGAGAASGSVPGGQPSRRYCECGGRVISEQAMAAMLSRQSTPGLMQSDLVQSFTRAGPLTASLLRGMGLVDAAAVEAWRSEVWGHLGYGFGVWLQRNYRTGDDHVWLFGAFNTVAGLVTLSNGSTAAAVARTALRADNRTAVAAVGVGPATGGGTVTGVEEVGSTGPVRVAVTGVGMAAFSITWSLITGFLAM